MTEPANDSYKLERSMTAPDLHPPTAVRRVGLCKPIGGMACISSMSGRVAGVEGRMTRWRSGRGGRRQSGSGWNGIRSRSNHAQSS